jgi:hypothetical protein
MKAAGFSVAGPVNFSDEMNTHGHYDQQSYLQAEPEGVDAFYVWPKLDGTGFKGGSGEGQRLLDVEYGWRLDHEDLKAHNIPPPPNDPNSTDALHKTTEPAYWELSPRQTMIEAAWESFRKSDRSTWPM